MIRPIDTFQQQGNLEESDGGSDVASLGTNPSPAFNYPADDAAKRCAAEFVSTWEPTESGC